MYYVLYKNIIQRCYFQQDPSVLQIWRENKDNWVMITLEATGNALVAVIKEAVKRNRQNTGPAGTREKEEKKK